MTEEQHIIIEHGLAARGLRRDDHGILRPRTLPHPDAVQSYYRDTYYQETHADVLHKEMREWWYWRQVYLDRVVRTWRDAKMMHTFPYGVLDVGAGYGWFLQAADESLGPRDIWEFCAIEPNDYARSLCGNLGFDVARTLPIESRFFDIVHASLLLEHVHDPHATMRLMANAMWSGGVCCVVVPNEFNPLQRQLTDRFGYTPVAAEHLSYFTMGSIQRLVADAGLEVYDVEATFPMEWFALHGLNYVEHPRLGSVAHKLRMAFEYACRKVGAWDKLAHRWAEQGIGREVVVWARKPDLYGA